MSGPTTRPIRDDRQPLDYVAADQDRADRARQQQQGDKGKQAAHQQTEQRPRGIAAALIALLPERARPLAIVLWGCGWCIAFCSLAFVGSVEWHYITVPWFTPHTAAAADVEQNTRDIRSIASDVSKLLDMQQRSRILELTQMLCHGYDKSLRLELDQLLEDYRRRNGTMYAPQVECDVRKDN